MKKQEELLNLLVKENLIKEDKVEKIKKEAERQEKSLEETILKMRLVDKEVLIKAKADVYGLKYQSLFDVKMSEEALNIIPFEVAENYHIVCFEIVERSVKIGITDPNNFKAIEAVDFLAKREGYGVEYYLISKDSFEHAYKQHKSISSEVMSVLKEKEEEDEGLIEIKEKEVEKVELEEIVKSAPVTKIVSVIIRHAVEGRASDIHIEPLLRETRVRYRVDGILNVSLILPKNIHYAVVARIKVLANLKLDETRIPQEGRIRLLIDNKEIDFRISIIPLVDNEKVVMRVLDVTKGAPTLDELGFAGHSLRTIKSNVKKTYGIFLISGPTGSGKSTTLFSILNILNKEAVNISTLEDPVEYYVSGISQSQIRPNLGFTFASGLRTLLRQDPDIMMVGEIRDNETAELAIHAALTGHLVLSTLHTNNSLGAIPRLLDMGVEPFLLGSTLNTILAQRLSRRICSNCKIKEDVPDDVLKDVIEELNNIPKEIMKKRIPNFDPANLTFQKGKGCTRCGKTGYSGRIAISEAIDINKKLREKVLNSKEFLTDQDIVDNQKFINLKQDGIIKVMQGLTTIEEVLRVARD